MHLSPRTRLLCCEASLFWKANRDNARAAAPILPHKGTLWWLPEPHPLEGSSGPPLSRSAPSMCPSLRKQCTHEKATPQEIYPPQSPGRTRQSRLSSPREYTLLFYYVVFYSRLHFPISDKTQDCAFLWPKEKKKKPNTLKCISKQKNKFCPEVNSVTPLEWRKKKKN